MDNKKTISILLGLILLCLVLIFVGLNSKTSPLGLVNDTYIADDFTHSTTSVGFYKSIIGNPTLLKDADASRQTLECTPNGSIRIWLSNATSTSMTVKTNSDGRLIATSTNWNMKDYGYIYPKKIWALAEYTTTTVSCIEN